MLHRYWPLTPAWLRTVLSIEGLVLPSECRLLYRLAREAEGGDIVEIGAFRGRATAALAFGSRSGPRATVHAVDPHRDAVGVFGQRYGPADARLWQSNLAAIGVTGIVREVRLASVDAAATWRVPVALLFVDGDHVYRAARADVEAWAPHLVPGATLVLHDSTRPDVGPARVVRELAASGRWAIAERVSDTTVLRAAPAHDPSSGLAQRASPDPEGDGS